MISYHKQNTHLSAKNLALLQERSDRLESLQYSLSAVPSLQVKQSSVSWSLDKVGSDLCQEEIEAAQEMGHE